MSINDGGGDRTQQRWQWVDPSRAHAPPTADRRQQDPGGHCESPKWSSWRRSTNYADVGEGSRLNLEICLPGS